jgi:hypothetical protein
MCMFCRLVFVPLSFFFWQFRRFADSDYPFGIFKLLILFFNTPDSSKQNNYMVYIYTHATCSLLLKGLCKFLLFLHVEWSNNICTNRDMWPIWTTSRIGRVHQDDKDKQQTWQKKPSKAYPSGAREFTPGFNGVCVPRSLVLCVLFCRSFFVLVSLFCVVDLRIPLIFSNSS